MYSMFVSVELAAAYLNPPPQLKARANQLPELTRQSQPDPDPKPVLGTGTTNSAWALTRRLSEATRSAIVADYQAGSRQQVLADRYEISLSSIKRLLRLAEGRSATQVAVACGYSSPNAFVSAFSAAFNRTPGSLYRHDR